MITSTATFQPPQSPFRSSYVQNQQDAMSSFSYSDSPLTQLPQPDFSFDELRRRITEFTNKFDAYLERGRRQVLSERNAFRARLSELNDEQVSSQTQIQTLQSSLATHSHNLNREAREKSEIQTQISQLSSHTDSRRHHREKLQQTIAATQRQIDAKKAAQQAYAEKIAAQSSLNEPELQTWETYLGTRISGAGEEGLIRVTYDFPPPRGEKEDRNAVFELAVPETGGYEIVYSKPILPAEDVAKVIGQVNESRDIAVLLRGMRKLFQAELGQRMTLR